MIPCKNLYRVHKNPVLQQFIINNSGNPEWLYTGNIVHYEILRVMKIMNKKWGKKGKIIRKKINIQK